MFASLIGSLLACGTLAAIVQVFITDGIAQSVSWIPFVTQATVWIVSPALVAGALLLSIIASVISLHRYLKARLTVQELPLQCAEGSRRSHSSE